MLYGVLPYIYEVSRLTTDWLMRPLRLLLFPKKAQFLPVLGNLFVPFAPKSITQLNLTF